MQGFETAPPPQLALLGNLWYSSLMHRLQFSEPDLLYSMYVVFDLI